MSLGPTSIQILVLSLGCDCDGDSLWAKEG